MPRLCLICNEYPPVLHGGIGTVSRELSEGFIKKGFSVCVIGVYNNTILSQHNVLTEYINDVKVIRIPAFSNIVPTQLRGFIDRARLLWWISREHRQKRLDFIEVPDYEGMLPWGNPFNIPVICRGHGSAFYFDDELKKRRASRLIYYFEKNTLANANHLIFVSKYTARREIELANIKMEYSVIYNGVDSTYFSPNIEQSKETGLILFVNTINPKKGVEPLMKAMNEVLSKNNLAKLRLLGKHPDEAYIQKLISMVDEKYHGRIEFYGHVDRAEVLRQMQQANLCIFPSFSEAFAMGPLEAMAVGCAVIYTKLASGSETLIDGESGLLCDPKDPIDIANKIITILNDHELANRLGNNARKRIVENFDMGMWIQKNVSFYSAIDNRA